MDLLREKVYQELGLRIRDIVKAKVKYMHDPSLNTQFDSELRQLKSQLQAESQNAKELTEAQVLKAWRQYEKSNIMREQSIVDFARRNPDLPKQMVGSFAQVEALRQEDNFFNDTGFEISDLLASLERLGLAQDERIKAISAEEYQKHAESLLKQTNDLMHKISHIETDLKRE